MREVRDVAEGTILGPPMAAARMRRSPARCRSVLIIGSEATPYAKTGGLADVLGALPSAIARLDCDVTLALPRYRGVSEGALVERFPLAVGGFATTVGLYEVLLDERMRILLVDEPGLYDRENLYGVGNVDYPDNARRFAVLVRAALEFASRRETPPDVVHGHDWQAGLAPVYLKSLYAKHPVLGGIPSVLTIHNLAYQGLFDPDWLPRLDLPRELLTVDRLEYWGRISFLKGGINDADVITTVSRTYAREIETPEYGCGFDGILRQRSDDLIGILNGIDSEKWNPATDPFLPAPYSVEDISGKRTAKAALLARYGLPHDDVAMSRPVVAMISRMVDQKGFDLIAAVAGELPHMGAGFVVLGTGEARYEDLWRGLAASYPDRIGIRIGFDEPLAHLIEGGADLFLMPSKFEPCGLNQLYSLRYGTVPVVRAVGGLADTVQDRAVRPGARESPSLGGAPRRSLSAAMASERRTAWNGFVFHDYSPQALLEALRRALTVFEDKRVWRALQTTGMKQDYSWDRSAREYVRIYDRLVRARGPNRRRG